jgi:acetylornithine deacetylase/succinyl-diaminopimelate desuccinylase-like protein
VAAETGSGAVVELLGTLIRNGCVSGGWPSSGEESRNAADLRAVLEGPGLDLEWFEPVPGRASLIARISGAEPSSPSLCLLGHTDVVAAGTEGWRLDPFGGDVVDGEVWGRGAVDMLNQTAAMALAVRRLADEGFRPAGDLVFWAVPDEECGGLMGAKLVLDSAPDLVRTEYALTEVGGAVRQGRSGALIDAYVADKGGGRVLITVRGQAGHSSLPYAASNALVRAAEVVRRLDGWRPAIRISEAWRRWVRTQEFSKDVMEGLIDAQRIDEILPTLPSDVAANAHACTRCTAVPTIVTGGQASNIIPSTVALTVNVRPTLGDDLDAIMAELCLLLSDLVAPQDVVAQELIAATESSTRTPLWHVLEGLVADTYPGGRLVPSVLPAQTDARWLRPAGTTTYGFGLLSDRLTPREYWSRFHGCNERIDIESLTLSLHGWYEVARRFLG